jgi:hypothetical protein
MNYETIPPKHEEAIRKAADLAKSTNTEVLVRLDNGAWIRFKPDCDVNNMLSYYFYASHKAEHFYVTYFREAMGKAEQSLHSKRVAQAIINDLNIDL